MDERGMTPSNGMNLAMRNELYESMPYYGVMPRIASIFPTSIYCIIDVISVAILIAP